MADLKGKEATLEEQCSEILRKINDGQQESAFSELKLLLSNERFSQNARSPENNSIGECAAIIMKNFNRNICTDSAKKCNVKEGEVVLEVGTGGHGYALDVLLRTVGVKKVVGIEISDSLRAEVGNRFASKIQSHELELFGQDCKDLSAIFPASNCIDCILAINVVYFLDPLDDYLKEFHRVLKPGTGRILFSLKQSSEKKDSENKSTIFRNLDFQKIARKCEDAGFVVDLEEVHYEEHPDMNNFVLIKLHKL